MIVFSAAYDCLLTSRFNPCKILTPLTERVKMLLNFI